MVVVSFSEHVAELAECGNATFRRSHDKAVLVSQDDGKNGDDGRVFNTKYMTRKEVTKTLDTGPLPAPSSRPIAPRSGHGLGNVYVIEKRAGGVFPDRIGVGRASNADVSIPLPRISKYHAYFSVSPHGAGHHTLTDAGSTNGTTVEERPLAPKEPVELESGDLISFGPHRFVYLSPDGFLRWVARYAKTS